MSIEMIRPQINDDKWDELETYLLNQWRRSIRARVEQVDSKFSDWEAAYRGIPREKVRTVPWPKSSNVVVQIVRLFIDTFVARTQGIVFSTRPLYSVDTYPREQRDALEIYLHKKAIHSWKHYPLFSQMLMRGTKQGTAVVKVNWVDEKTIDVTRSGSEQGWDENELTKFSGPRATCIPFDDFAVYPITANDFSQVEIKFHRVRYTLERAIRKLRNNLWTKITEEEINSSGKVPQDIKRNQDQESAGVTDTHLRELHMIECYLDYAIGNDESRYYSLVAIINPELDRLVDVYFNPNPSNYEMFYRYSPNPREDLFFGESWSEILAAAQEECSQIHNDRRNAAFLGSAPVFKRKRGADVPNPSTTWYPGKVFDVEDMDDFEPVSVGHNIGDLLNEEMQVINIAERLMGIGPIMQGMSQGSQGKGNVYNTGGTLGVISEGNQRQDAIIADARDVLGEIGKCSFYLQSYFDPRDSFLSGLPPEIASVVTQILQQVSASRLQATQFQIKASNAAVNKETEKASLLQMANVLAQYSQTLQQLAPQFLQMEQSHSPLAPMIQKILEMAAWMVKRLLKAFDEYDAEGVIPDVRQLFGSPGGGTPSTQGPVQGVGAAGMEPVGSGGAGAILSRPGLQGLGTALNGALANGGGGGVAM